MGSHRHERAAEELIVVFFVGIFDPRTIDRRYQKCELFNGDEALRQLLVTANHTSSQQDDEFVAMNCGVYHFQHEGQHPPGACSLVTPKAWCFSILAFPYCVDSPERGGRVLARKSGARFFPTSLSVRRTLQPA